ncbi:MAG: type IV toxin-antitoxin system AbiEi family antitoxin domain-containing protein, partial [Thermoplasmata archaeon]|nr:type IV toxin-antitoxin system AbiEi family antitoxin domain-containing protein [Thermoplasmata archaeon]
GECGLTKHNLDSYSISISTPERAMMEVLYLVPQKQSFEDAGLLMEGMTTFRPRLVQELLELCNSIKVKRLFMFMATHYRHAWVSKLNLSKVDFGTGKRLIVKGGRLDSRYQITIPESFHEEEGASA